jgi:CPA1 family monovalent cation:H+ antiporter
VSIFVPAVLLRLRDVIAPHALAVLTWGGLRGGISVALALSLPAGAPRAHLLPVCYAVVVFTIIVQGLTMPRLVRDFSPEAETQAA